MNNKILFIQGSGEADKALLYSLQQNLGNEYDIVYPEIQSIESAPGFGWIQ